MEPIWVYAARANYNLISLLYWKSIFLIVCEPVKGKLFLRNLGHLMAAVPMRANSCTLKSWAFVNVLAEQN